jgi:hypothetical protein
MSNKASNVIQFMATNTDNKDIHQYALKDMPYNELRDVVEQELQQLVKNVLPHNFNPEDIRLLDKALRELLITDE